MTPRQRDAMLRAMGDSRRALCWIAIAFVACKNPPKADDAVGGSAGSGGSGSGSQMPSIRHYTPDYVKIVAPPIALPKQESFAVIDPGKGPKLVLRYALAAAVVEHHVETRLKSRQLEHGKFADAVDVPPLRDGFAATTAPGEPLALRPLDGQIAGKSTPFAEQYLATWREKLQNRRITLAFDTRGQLGEITFNDDPENRRSAAAKDELVQRLLAMTVPLPETAIGDGATWQVTTVLRQGPVYIKQTATYTLVSHAATWKLHVKLLRVGEEQSVADPNLPKGATADLVALFRQLEGDLVVDPKQALVSSGSMTVESRLHARVQLPGQELIEQVLEDTGSVTFTSSSSSSSSPTP